MANHPIDKTKYSEYKTIEKNGLHFIIDKEEEKKFQSWVNEYGNVNDIPEDLCLTGYYLKQNIDGTNDWWGENDIKNESIPANRIEFSKT